MSVKEQHDPTIVRYVHGALTSLTDDLMQIYGIPESRAIAIIRDVAIVHCKRLHREIFDALKQIVKQITRSEAGS
jgi:hypothetical protein